MRPIALALVMLALCRSVALAAGGPSTPPCSPQQLSPFAAGDIEVYCGPTKGMAYTNQNLTACQKPEIVPTIPGQQRVYCGPTLGWVWGLSTLGIAACTGPHDLSPQVAGEVPIFCGATLGMVWAAMPFPGCLSGALDFTEPCNSAWIF